MNQKPRYSSKSRRSPQAVGGLVEALGIGVGAGHAYQPPVVAVGPAVIDALETAPVALALGADDGTAVAAGVEQAMERAGLIAAEDYRPAGDLARAEIARLCQFGGMADIDPAAAANL